MRWVQADLTLTKSQCLITDRSKGCGTGAEPLHDLNSRLHLQTNQRILGENHPAVQPWSSGRPHLQHFQHFQHFNRTKPKCSKWAKWSKRLRIGDPKRQGQVWYKLVQYQDVSGHIRPHWAARERTLPHESPAGHGSLFAQWSWHWSDHWKKRWMDAMDVFKNFKSGEYSSNWSMVVNWSLCRLVLDPKSPNEAVCIYESTTPLGSVPKSLRVHDQVRIWSTDYGTFGILNIWHPDPMFLNWRHCLVFGEQKEQGKWNLWNSPFGNRRAEDVSCAKVTPRCLFCQVENILYASVELFCAASCLPNLPTQQWPVTRCTLAELIRTDPNCFTICQGLSSYHSLTVVLPRDW